MAQIKTKKTSLRALLMALVVIALGACSVSWAKGYGQNHQINLSDPVPEAERRTVIGSLFNKVDVGLENCLGTYQGEDRLIKCYTDAYNKWEKRMKDNFKNALANCDKLDTFRSNVSISDIGICKSELRRNQQNWEAFTRNYAKALPMIHGLETGEFKELIVLQYKYQVTREQAILLRLHTSSALDKDYLDN